MPLGPLSWHLHFSSAYEGDAGLLWARRLQGVFKLMLDRNNYPLVFHCIAGQDRTAAVAFILNGLLGVAEDDLARDWEVSGFHNASTLFAHWRLYDRLVAGFDRIRRATLQEKIENYSSISALRVTISRHSAALCWRVIEPLARRWRSARRQDGGGAATLSESPRPHRDAHLHVAACSQAG